MTSKTRLYVGKLHEQTRERDLEKFVREYGKIREISIKRGYGFVEFYDAHDAKDAVYELNGRELLGERVIIEHAREPSARKDYGFSSRPRDSRRGYGQRDYYRKNPPVRTEYRLNVENLSSRINWQELKEIFNEIGDVAFTDAHKRKIGTGIVEFIRRDDMKAAMKKMDGKKLNGKEIRLTIDSDRSRSRSRSRGRRSRSHSPQRRRHRSRSRSPKRSRSKSTSKTREDMKQASRSRSKSEEVKSRSQSPEKDGDESNRESGHESGNESPNRIDEDDVQNEEDE